MLEQYLLMMPKKVINGSKALEVRKRSLTKQSQIIKIILLQKHRLEKV